MSVLASRHEIHKMLDSLPPEALPDLLDYLDYLRYRAGRQTLGACAEEAIRLYADGEISLGRAAEMAGVNYFRFEQILRKRGVRLAEPQAPQAADIALQQELVDELLG